MTRHQTRTFLAFVRWQRRFTPTRPYRLIELMRVLRADAATTALALKLNSWQLQKLRETRRNRRQLMTWWIPPGGRLMPCRRRGRPSFADLLYPNT